MPRGASPPYSRWSSASMPVATQRDLLARCPSSNSSRAVRGDGAKCLDTVSSSSLASGPLQFTASLTSSADRDSSAAASPKPPLDSFPCISCDSDLTLVSLLGRRVANDAHAVVSITNQPTSNRFWLDGAPTNQRLINHR